MELPAVRVAESQEELDQDSNAKTAVYDDEEDFKDARDTLSKFVIGKPAEDS